MSSKLFLVLGAGGVAALLYAKEIKENRHLAVRAIKWIHDHAGRILGRISARIAKAGYAPNAADRKVVKLPEARTR